MDRILGNSDWDRTGFLTARDKAWLRGDKDGSNRKHLTGQAVARAMRDIRFLCETDTETTYEPSIDDLGELCNSLYEAGMTPYEAGKYLVALAYILTNQTFEYADLIEDIDLHPRQDENPQSGEWPIKGAPYIPGQEINEILTFRRALADGIKIGKERVETEAQGVEIPDKILIDANTPLYKAPTKERMEAAFSTEDWRDAIAATLEADSPYDPPDPTEQDEEEMRPFTARMRRGEIKNNIESYLSHRRLLSSHEMRRHDNGHGPEDLPYQRSVVVEEIIHDWDEDPDDEDPPIKLGVDIESRLLTSEDTPQLVIEVSNPRDKPLSLIGSDSSADLILPTRTDDTETLVLLTEEEESSATTIPVKSACKVTNNLPSHKSNNTLGIRLDPGQEITHTYYLYRYIPDLNEIDRDSATPDDGIYRFASSYSLSGPNAEDSQEMTVDFALGIKP